MLLRPSLFLSLFLLLRFELSHALAVASRRAVLGRLVSAAASVLLSSPTKATAEDAADFVTTAYGRQEYTNSITASRDTNLSPAEAYDVIRQQIPACVVGDDNREHRALDLGAGAGLSTAVLYKEKGYRTIDAVDWSSTAWEDSVTQQPPTLRFFQMDDSSFFDIALKESRKYDCICYNFAVNTDKAIYAAKMFLTDTGLLLAPCNDRRDYWYKQSYLVLNARGEVVWKSAADVGAWSVQFQPDVTSPTCTGIWCGGFNGFQQQG